MKLQISGKVSWPLITTPQTNVISKTYLSLVFYDNRNLKIYKSKKSEQYSVIKSNFLSDSSMNTLLAILKVTDVRRDVILAGGLYHRFPLRHLPPTPCFCPNSNYFFDKKIWFYLRKRPMNFAYISGAAFNDQMF